MGTFDTGRIAVRTRQDLLLFPSKVQIQHVVAPGGFNEACTADILRALSADAIRTVPAGRGTLGGILPRSREKTMREIFRRCLRHYVNTFYRPEIHAQVEFQLELFPLIRHGEGKVLGVHSHAESFVAMVYYPAAVDCSKPALLSGGGTEYLQNQLVLCPPLGARIEERFSRQPNMNVPLSPARGTMIVSPGNLPHFVAPSGKNDVRVSVVGVVSTTPKTASPLPALS